MIPEIGHFALIMALGIAFVQAIFPLIGSLAGPRSWVSLARPAASAQFLFMLISFLALVNAFLSNDFSVLYVAQNGNSQLPTLFKISAVWGAHEGSLLLWGLVLAGWGLAVAIFSKGLPDVVVARVLSVMGMIAIGFLLFLVLTSNPFERLYPAPMEGRDLNPLLQDVGLAIHPPMLYMGYVGFSVAFAFAIAALIGGKLDSAWARWSRPWTTVAWVFLTVGIALGSWWAYYELGWGGWWFWDPVENASFMPWLVGTALIHSLAVTEKRTAFKRWTVLLAIFAFSLSLLGTFLVRSGVLTSVHAFASDPARGVFILIFLLVVVGGSLLLYAWRAPSVLSGGNFDVISRETFLLSNNVILSIVAVTVLLGTLYPLVLDALDMGKISVGFPYFNSVFIPLMVPLVFLMGIGPLVRWKHQDPMELVRKLRFWFVASVAIAAAFAFPILGEGSPKAGLGLGLASWVLFAIIQSIRELFRHRSGWAALTSQGRSYYGMILAHLGIAVTTVGITMVSLYGAEADVRLGPGESQTLAGYEFVFQGVKQLPGPNYIANEADIEVFRDGQPVARLTPEKRTYQVQKNAMTEAAIDAGLTRDIYISLGEPLGDGAWSVRLYYKPFVRWIWLGAIFMALGGLLAVLDPRYRVAARSRRKVSAGVMAEGAKA